MRVRIPEWDAFKDSLSDRERTCEYPVIVSDDSGFLGEPSQIADIEWQGAALVFCNFQ